LIELKTFSGMLDLAFGQLGYRGVMSAFLKIEMIISPKKSSEKIRPEV
jgi:hypothetical protein